MTEMNQEGKSRPLRSTAVVIVLAAAVATVTVFVVLQIEWALSITWPPAQISNAFDRKLVIPQTGPAGPSLPPAQPKPQPEQAPSTPGR